MSSAESRLYRERPIIYCAENFIDDYAIHEF